MGRSRLGWACNAIAPWVLGLGLVVSITAEAGQDPTQGAGASVALEGAKSPIRAAQSSSAFRLPRNPFLDQADGRPPTLEASLTLGGRDDLAEVDDEIEPRRDLKQAGAHFPEVDRTRKSDPFLALRPGFDARLNRRPKTDPDPRAGRAADEAAISFGDPFSAADAAIAYGEPPTDPDAPDAGAPNEPQMTFDDGATPSVPLSVALNSATPAPSEDLPIATLAAKPGAPGAETTQIAKTNPDGKPDYASLIDPKDAARQQRCLSEAVYFEARGEPEEGQAAVAQVVLNRVRSGLYPANVCGVVYQDRNRPFACQFSFACEGHSLRVTEPGPWAVAVRIAKDVTDGTLYNPTVGAAVNYHANYVMPYWASALKRVDRIGHHIFYELRVGQN